MTDMHALDALPDSASQPTRAEVSAHPRLAIMQNNLATNLLTRMRDRRTGITEFTVLAEQLATSLLWTAGADLRLAPTSVAGFAGTPVAAAVLDERVAGVVVLRAGLAFARPFRALFAEAPLYQVGVERDEASLEPRVYAANLPQAPGWADRVLVLDPMLATGGSVVATLELVRRSYVGRIDVLALIAAPLGVARVLAADAACNVWVAALDEQLDSRGYIMPGLGDAGDRLFGTRSAVAAAAHRPE